MELIEISKKEYESLIKDSYQLQVLEQRGVDNWGEYRRTASVNFEFEYKLIGISEESKIYTANWECDDDEDDDEN